MQRRSLFRRWRQETPPVAPLVSSAVALEGFEESKRNYLLFCEDSIPYTELEVDFLRLVTEPRVAAIAFSNRDDGMRMYIGTTLVTIRDPNTKQLHKIGEFIITVNRNPSEVRYQNLMGGIGINGDKYPHPHIFESGEMCMSVGKDILHEHLNRGEVYEAVRYMLAGLWRVDSGQIPGANIKHWPIVRE